MQTYDAGIMYSPRFLTTEYVFRKYGEYEIFAYYLGAKFRVNDSFSSPFRDDAHPSFGIFEGVKGNLLYKDLKYGDSGNAVKFVRKLFPYLRTNKDAILKIHIDLNKERTLHTIKNDPTYAIPKKRVDVGINRGNYSSEDLEYWSQFNITKNILEKYKVYRAERVYIDENLIWVYENHNPIYAYKIFNHFKIYRPLSLDKKRKWLGNCNRFDVAGFEQLPETASNLIITKSLKDVMCLYSFNYFAIAPSAETISIPSNVISNLKKRFQNIIIFYDNDEAGMISADKLSKKYNLPTVFIPIEKGVKDITDYVAKYSTKNTPKFLNELLKY